MFTEVENLYFFYMKTCIMDYLLLDPFEQRRLGIRQLNYTPAWGGYAGRRPQVRNMHYSALKKELMQYLVSYSDCSIEVMRMWDTFIRKKRLLELEEKQVVAMPVQTFCGLQLDKMASAKRILQTQWVSAIQQAIEFYLKEESLHTTEHSQRLYRVTLAQIGKLQRTWVDEALMQFTSYVRLWEHHNAQ